MKLYVGLRKLHCSQCDSEGGQLDSVSHSLHITMLAYTHTHIHSSQRTVDGGWRRGREYPGGFKAD